MYHLFPPFWRLGHLNQGLGCLDGVWKVSLSCLDTNGRCPGYVCNELGVRSVSRVPIVDLFGP